jgi:hypothetical protein
MVPDVVGRQLLADGGARVPDRASRDVGSIADLVIATTAGAGPSLLVAFEKDAIRSVAGRLWKALKRSRTDDDRSIAFELTWTEGRVRLRVDVTDPEALELLEDVLGAVRDRDRRP